MSAGEELGNALSKILAGRNALIVASSDLHHIANYDQVMRRDKQSIDAIASMDLARIKRALSPRDCSVCGRVPIYAMLTAATAAGANRVEILHYTNSGDVTGIRTPGQYTVGYLAAAAIRERLARMFAVVAVNTPVHRGGTALLDAPAPQASQTHTYPGPVFHYDIPPDLHEQVLPGTLIQVPLDRERFRPWSLPCLYARPVQELKSVTKLLYPEPVLLPQQIDLGLVGQQTHTSAR